ncbi:MAG TPA: hypothetical protein VFV63_13155 [Ilumatobacteraceae bacterium]|nr:hypothetical protein [Ilumatobacteraceae bacterium]
MTVHDDIRTTARTAMVPEMHRGSAESTIRRRVVPAALAGLAIAALVGVNELRSTDNTAPTRPPTVPVVNGGFEALIGPEELAFINGEYSRTPVIDLCATQRPC